MWKFRGNEFMQTKRPKDVMKSVDDRIEIREVHLIFFPILLCWCWRLLLEWCERKTLLAGWRSSQQNRVNIAAGE